ncbi:MAG: DNA2/NAM7 family helicase [Prevotella sp.]|nr:DNA2/NAM7 family helicase [Prevotella sp.]
MKKTTKSYVTAADLFDRVAEILDLPEGKAANRLMHETLVLCCSEALRNEKMAFGNLFSQVDFLCKRFRMRLGDVAAIQKMRRDSNRRKPMAREDVLYGCRALAMFIAAVFETSIPATLVGRIPPTNKPREDKKLAEERFECLRCIVDEFDDATIRVTVDDDEAEAFIVDYSAEHLHHLQPILRRDMQLNLLDATRETDRLVPKLIVVEPDYLLDISSIATCFQPIGHHPMAYTINRLAPNANSQALLLGNFAGRALDDIINSDGDYDWRSTLRAHFRQQALDYCACDDLNRNEDFKQAAARQAANIVQIVEELFTLNIDNSKFNIQNSTIQPSKFNIQNSILEPSFVCERLGLQGRVDLMTTDFSLLVEQKSGKNFNIERNRRNEFGSFQKEDHYVQLLLYYGILTQNFHLGTRKIDARLLYSKYPLPGGLVAVNFYQKLFHEAIALRNRIADIDFRIATQGFESILDDLNAETLNEKRLSSVLFEQYIKPQTEAVTEPIHRLSPLEKSYVCRMLTFCYREQLASRLDNRQKPGGGVADLWNLPTAEKKELGNIFTDLTIIEKEKSDPDRGYDLITLAVPDQGENFLPNFRNGDSVYLYAYTDEPDARRSLLFRATLIDISANQLTVALRDGQKNPNVLSLSSSSSLSLPFHSPSIPLKYAIEHCEIGGSAPMKAIAAFASAAPSRRALLLGQREPQIDASQQLSRSYHPAYDEVLLKAKQAQDYFLLIGPPGTGKTSMALRFLVEEALADPPKCAENPSSLLVPRSSILLTAYTNRAVDEICDMLETAELDYMRIGRRYSCDRRFRHRLLQQTIGDQPQLSAIRKRLDEVRIVVGTTTSLQAQMSLFTLKNFSLLIVDEASQILEPQLIGLLCQVPKFILIGDHKQLPAVVQQSEAESEVTDEKLREIGLTNCRNSLFERLLNGNSGDNQTPLPSGGVGGGSLIGILRRQGRMHPDIAEWPNRMFYRREKLLPVPLPHQEEASETPRVVFIPAKNPIDSEKSLSLPFHSSSIPFPSLPKSDKVNVSEARIVACELKKIFEEYGEKFNPDKSVGVIVPYRNQISMIRREIEALAIPELLQISIDTVERYQGSQRDVIIYSTTVTHRYQLDFLCANTFEEDGAVIDRKLNVALTRARCRLIITGHEPTLRQDPLYCDLLDFISRSSSNFSFK